MTADDEAMHQFEHQHVHLGFFSLITLWFQGPEKVVLQTTVTCFFIFIPCYQLWYNRTVLLPPSPYHYNYWARTGLITIQGLPWPSQVSLSWDGASFIMQVEHISMAIIWWAFYHWRLSDNMLGAPLPRIMKTLSSCLHCLGNTSIVFT
jgi:hypothetical protein